jgi:hypothetical protein
MDYVNTIQLLQLHILRAFFRALDVDVTNRDLEIQDLLSKIRDSDYDVVAVIKAVRNFGRAQYTFEINKNLHPNSVVYTAIKEGIAEFGSYPEYRGGVGNADAIQDALFVRVFLDTPPRCSLKEAKDIVDQLRSMRQDI